MAAATLTEILDDLNDYSDYEEVGSVSRARSFITAARRWLALPSTSAEQGSSMGYTPSSIQEEIRVARAYIAANATATADNSAVKFLSIGQGFHR